MSHTMRFVVRSLGVDCADRYSIGASSERSRLHADYAQTEDVRRRRQLSSEEPCIVKALPRWGMLVMSSFEISGEPSGANGSPNGSPACPKMQNAVPAGARTA